MQWWTRVSKRYKAVKKEYGRVAIGTYLVLWVLVLAAYAVAIKLGHEVEGVAGGGGIIFGAWVAAKVTQPARIVLTIVLTPVVAAVLRRPPVVLASSEEE